MEHPEDAHADAGGPTPLPAAVWCLGGPGWGGSVPASAVEPSERPSA